MTKFVKKLAGFMAATLCMGTVTVSAAPADDWNTIDNNTIHMENISMDISTDEANLAVATTDDYAMVHETADDASDPVGKLYKGNLVNVIEEIDDEWSLIESGNLTGYVSSTVLDKNEEAVANAEVTIATVDVDNLHVRAEASMEGEILDQVDSQTTFEVVSQEEDGWVEVALEQPENPSETECDEKESEVDSETADTDAATVQNETPDIQQAEAPKGFVAAELVTISTQYTYGETLEEEADRLAVEEEQANRNVGQEVIDYAVQFVGNPYVYGGSSLTKGTDCSGFVMSVYKHFGVDLPHSSKSLRSVGYEVSEDEMQAGDIVCYSGHVALYMGDGRIVHASNRKTGIIISDSINYRSVLSVRRIF